METSDNDEIMAESGGLLYMLYETECTLKKQLAPQTDNFLRV